MKRYLKSKLVLSLVALVLITSAITIPLAGSILHTHAASPTPPVSISSIQGTFYNNPSNSGTFDPSVLSSPVFSQQFPVIGFDPPSAAQVSCSNATGIDENTRPFTDVVPQSNGTCSTVVAQDPKNPSTQAGLGSLSMFQATFTANLTLANAGDVTFNFFSDDGWILASGPEASHPIPANQPTYVSGSLVNAPASGYITKFPIVGSFNQPSSPAQNTVKVHFPVSGTYPIEVDYTECCGGPETLVLGTSFGNPIPPPPPSMQADLSITKTVMPQAGPVVVEKQGLTYTITVINHGPGDATGVHVTDMLPKSIFLPLASTLHGTCTVVVSIVFCDLGSLAAGQSAQITITGIAEAHGTITNIATVKADQPDPTLADNTTTLNTQVFGEFTTIIDASCSNPKLIALIPDADSEVNGTVQLRTTDPGGSAAEVAAGHFLFLKEKFGPFKQTIKDFNNPVFFHFTAAENQDQLTACILPGTDKKGPDGDEQAIVTVTSPDLGLKNYTDFLEVVSHVPGCVADFTPVGLTAKALKLTGNFITFGQILEDIVDGHATVASILFDKLDLPFRDCVEGLLALYVPGFEAGVRACLTGGTQADVQCRRNWTKGLSDIVVDPLIFIRF
jgi:uncharacterized repeat protein (TIGR01451 family)